MKIPSLIAILAVVMFLGGCAGPGARVEIPLAMPDGETATIVAHNQIAPDWLLDRDQLALNYITRRNVSERQLAAVAETERACRIYTKTVRPHNLVAVLSSGILYAVAGFTGVGAGSQVFAGAKFLEYGAYGAGATGTAGAANGLVSIAGQTYTFENCGREVFGLFPQYEVRILNKSPQ